MFAIVTSGRCLRLCGEGYRFEEDRLHVIYSTPRDRAILSLEFKQLVARIVVGYATCWRQQPTVFNLHKGEVRGQLTLI